MSTKNNQPDMIAQVGAMLNRLAACEWASPTMAAAITENDLDIDEERITEATLVISSAVLAVAAELRDVANELRTVNGWMAAAAKCEAVAYPADELDQDNCGKY
jgi:hypothetical protein